ncbi:serine/threonine-protein kinase [Hahella aquimaris]|uniref:serine/threonine protein kinase n=1 Tax=Hahella sp. HNIBRBA332 TaxID=3015983 RepID=UPI00273C954E|nr:serine/threonine-protein kinase [Hahella sp. HNIBRBA332]WLQ17107.1 serine/threonine-protein kinase [Hahella sp. HNIBRBA332]
MSDTQIFDPASMDSQYFGKYKVQRELGRGAMGVVYQCFDPDFERIVAVKVLLPELLGADVTGEFRERFRNEMRAAGKISHPNVINVFDAGDQDGAPFFVMEYVEGYELKSSLDDGQRFPIDKTLKIMTDVLSGLGHIHEHGIIHRDLKPANIFITKNGVAKIADFGVAKLESSELTRVGTIIGSPRYMSPEQCQGLPVDARSDLFAAGIIFYQLLTNEHCFNANSPTAIMQKILHARPELPSMLIPTLSKHYDAVVVKALEKSPEKRYQSAEEFIQALLQAAEGKKSSNIKGPMFAGAGGLLAVAAAGLLYVLMPSVGQNGVTPPVETTKLTPRTVNGTATTPNQSGNGVQAHADNNGNSGNASTPDGDQNGSTSQNASTAGADNPVRPASAEVQSLNPEVSAKIDRLLKVAKVHRLQGRLVTPSGSSAYDAYKIVLEIDPTNQVAQEGLKTLEHDLVSRIDELRDQGELQMAQAEATTGSQLFPSSEQLSKLAAQLKK